MVRYSWRTQLKGSGTVDAVLSVVHQFLDEWTQDERAMLPQGCWPGPLNSRKDVLHCAFALADKHAKFEGNSASLARLQELLLFFTHVSVRITQVERLKSDESANAPAFLDTDPGKAALEPSTSPPDRPAKKR